MLAWEKRPREERRDQLSKKLGTRIIDNNGETTFSGDEVTGDTRNCQQKEWDHHNRQFHVVIM